jgi:hypothetical protein
VNHEDMLAGERCFDGWWEMSADGREACRSSDRDIGRMSVGGGSNRRVKRVGQYASDQQFCPLKRKKG